MAELCKRKKGRICRIECYITTVDKYSSSIRLRKDVFHLYVQVHTLLHTHSYTHTLTHMYTHVHTCTHMYTLYISLTHIHTHAYTCINTLSFFLTHSPTQPYTHSHTHTHMHSKLSNIYECTYKKSLGVRLHRGHKNMKEKKAIS